MADVKWIKIVTDIFDDEKILLIESLPEKDTIITCWFKLLCLAGKQNNSGVFLLNNRIPYTDEMFATIFRRPVNSVRMALDAFENFGMIERINGTVTIPNWDKHQSLDALERKREYQKELMRKRRAEQKLLANCDANSDANVSCLDKNREEVEEEEIRTEEDKNSYLSVSTGIGVQGGEDDPLIGLAERVQEAGLPTYLPTEERRMDFAGLIKVALRAGNRDLANHYWKLAKADGITLDIQKLKAEAGVA